MINTGEAQKLLDEISFQVQALQQAAKEINSIQDLSDIKSNLMSLKDFKVEVDTHKIEIELERELQTIKSKIAEIRSQFDFNELDVISKSLKEIKSETKSYRMTSLFYVSVVSVAIGYAINILHPILPYHIVNNEAKILNEFKTIGVKVDEQGGQKYISIPPVAHRFVNKQGELIITINKIR